MANTHRDLRLLPRHTELPSSYLVTETDLDPAEHARIVIALGSHDVIQRHRTFDIAAHIPPEVQAHSAAGRRCMVFVFRADLARVETTPDVAGLVEGIERETETARVVLREAQLNLARRTRVANDFGRIVGTPVELTAERELLGRQQIAEGCLPGC